MSIAGTWQSSYETSGYRDDYNSMIKRQILENDTIIEENETAIEEAKKLQENVEEGSTAWFEAQAAIDGYEEAVAEATTTQIELNRALQESNMERIVEEYQDATREVSHVQTMLTNFAQDALERNDYETYFASMNEYLNNVPTQVDAAKKKLNDLNKLYSDGMKAGTLDPAMQRELLDQIFEAESELQQIQLESRKAQREVVKQRISEMTNRQEWEAANYEHNQKQLGYQTSVYQTNGELTNYNSAIEEDNKLRKARVSSLKQDKEELEDSLTLVEKGSNEEKQLLDLIRKKDEAIASENAQIEKNNKLLEDNKKKITQLRKALQDSIDKEIEAEKKRQREILAGNVSLENNILDVIKKRYQDEWDLQKKSIEKEKESLNEYKKLINERFNYRKKAAQEADRDEELAEYKRQLALIQADPTRTREAKELEKKIKDLEKEQSWNVAEGELEAENERIDNQLESMDKFVQYNDEVLTEFLSDANNLADEVNNIMSGSFDDAYNKFIEFMSKENEAFMKSLPDSARQMVQSWEDTLKKAKDIVDNNYSDIENVLDIYNENGDLRSYEELSTGTYRQDYINWDFVFQAQDYEWGIPDDQLDELKNNLYKVNIDGINLEGGKKETAGEFDESDTKTKDFSEGLLYIAEDLDNLFIVFVKVQPKVEQQQQQQQQGNVSGGLKKYIVQQDNGQATTVYASSPEDAAKKAGVKATDDSGYSVYTEETTDKYGRTTRTQVLRQEDANTEVDKSVKSGVAINQYNDENNTGININPNEVYKDDGTKVDTSKDNKKTFVETVTDSLNSTVSALSSLISGVLNIDTSKAYSNAKGGLIDFTGPTWVDGTVANPEAFLSAKDTRNIRAMLDAFDTISVNPGVIPDASMFTDNSTNIGDINVTINQAELKDDADYAEVAKRVGEEFSKQIKRGGMNLSGYAFS